MKIFNKHLSDDLRLKLIPFIHGLSDAEVYEDAIFGVNGPYSGSFDAL